MLVPSSCCGSLARSPRTLGAGRVLIVSGLRPSRESPWQSDYSPAEIACRGTGRLLLNEAPLDSLQALRDRLRKPLIVLSAYRGPEHNRAVGGAKASKDLQGIVFDIAMGNHDPEVFAAAERAGPWAFSRNQLPHRTVGQVHPAAA
jgi:peptidase M15-like protein